MVVQEELGDDDPRMRYDLAIGYKEMGMLDEAVRVATWSPAECWMIGDKPADVELAAAAGLRPVLVRTGHGAEADLTRLPPGTIVVVDLAAAAARILEEASS